MKSLPTRALALAATAMLTLLANAGAQNFVDYGPILGLSNEEHTWNNFVLPTGVSPGVSGTAGQWAGTTTPTNRGIAANDGSTTDLFYVPLTPTGTAQYASEVTDFVGGGIYSFFSSTHLTVGSSSPLADTSTLILQLSIAAGTSGAFGGATVDLLSQPVLKLTLADNSTVSLAANYSLLEGTGPYFVPQLGSSTTLNTTGYQWDLSAIAQEITSYTVDFQLAYHAIVFGAQTNASTTEFNSSVLAAIPEPGTAAFGLMLIGGLLVRRSRTQTAVAA